MSNQRIYTGSSTVSRDTADGDWKNARGLRDGVPITADWLQSLVFEGRVFQGLAGSASSPATFAGAYDADGPDFVLNVPDNTIVIPVSVTVVLETTGASMFEIIGIASKTSCGTCTVTGGGTFTPQNLRIDDPVASVCTGYYAVDAAGCTDPHTAGNYVEFMRDGETGDPDAATSATNVFKWSALKDGVAPVIVNTGSLVVYASGTSGTGMINVVWVELPKNAII